MSRYADVYLLLIPEENIPAYKKLATAAGKLFIKHGALKYRGFGRKMSAYLLVARLLLWFQTTLGV